PQRLDLFAVELFAAEIGRIDLMRIDQHRIDAGTAEHGGCERAGHSAAGEDNISVPQLGLLKSSNPISGNAQGRLKLGSEGRAACSGGGTGNRRHHVGTVNQPLISSAADV